MSETLRNILLVLLFIGIGGFFAGAEIALVSVRESQIKALREDPRRGRRARRVGKLHEDPNRFLSAVQIGVTLAGFFSAAVGGATLADDLAPTLEDWGVPERFSNTVALVGITIVISYFSLVFGELVPKRLALQRAQGLSLFVAPVLDRIATLFRPVIWLLSVSTNVFVRMLGGDPHASHAEITEEELRDLVAGHRTLGARERELIDEVFAAGERQIREVMVPRTEVDFLDVATPVSVAAKTAAAKPHSRYPVVRGSHDEVIGFVHVRDLFDPELAGRAARVGDMVRDVMFLPATKRVLPALSEMQREGHHVAIVVDEYGGTAGIVTLEDLVEELLGEIRDEYDVAPRAARRLAAGAFEVDGLLNLDDFRDETGVPLPEGPYETVAGYVLSQLGRIAEMGDSVEFDGHKLTVIEKDGHRVARLRITPLSADLPDGDLTEGDPATDATDAAGDAGDAERGQISPL